MEAEVKSAHMETMHLSRVAKDQPHGYVLAAELLLSYHLPNVAQLATGMAKKIRGFPREPLTIAEVHFQSLIVTILTDCALTSESNLS